MPESLRAEAEAIANQYVPPEIGRPSYLSDANVVQKVLTSLRAGNYRETAIKHAGLSKQTFYTWLKQDNAFLDAVEKAEAEAECDAVANVRQAGKLPQFWAAEMTYLERRHPERWGKRSEDSSQPRVVVQIGVQHSDVQVTLSTSSDQPAHLSPPLITDFHSLSPTATELSCPIIGDYVNQPEAAPSSNLGARSPEGPTPATGSGRGRTKVAKQRARQVVGKKKGAQG